METMTEDEFYAEIKKQGAKHREDIVFVCPMCETPQCARDLINAGAGKDFSEVEGYLGFSCIGRFTGAGSPREAPDGKPCNWTLGGLFKAHKLEIIADNGMRIPTFEPATPDVAKRHIELMP